MAVWCAVVCAGRGLCCALESYEKVGVVWEGKMQCDGIWQGDALRVEWRARAQAWNQSATLLGPCAGREDLERATPQVHLPSQFD